MLILTRRIGEAIMINGEEVVVKILDVKGSQVRIGIEAPKNVSVYREEIWHKIQYEKENNIKGTMSVEKFQKSKVLDEIEVAPFKELRSLDDIRPEEYANR